LPDDVRLLDLLDVDATDPADVLRSWDARPATTTAVIGMDAEGVASIDLRRDGPHAWSQEQQVRESPNCCRP
jgi:S-DNA-T family DNA segregation ATPase FtsK/SpoIIIE